MTNMIEILDFKWILTPIYSYLCLVVNNPDNKFTEALEKITFIPSKQIDSFYIGKSNMGSNLLWLATDKAEGILLYLEITK